MKYFILDVFAEKKYAGNQLGVFLWEGARDPAEMQAIARELNFSETTFICSRLNGPRGFPVRIFTPEHEVDFAGHPTLGTAFIIREKILGKPVRTLSLDLKAGTVPVSFPEDRDGPLWMDQTAPVFGGTFPADSLSPVLGLPYEAFDRRFPIQEVSTGLPHFIVPLTSLPHLTAIRVDRARYFDLVSGTWAKNILVFCAQGRDDSHELSVRMFADYLGIPEDPATGSGNGCLAAYLVKHAYFGSGPLETRVGQGHEVGRPSHLYLRAEDGGDSIAVSVGGRVIEISEGEWR